MAGPLVVNGLLEHRGERVIGESCENRKLRTFPRAIRKYVQLDWRPQCTSGGRFAIANKIVSAANFDSLALKYYNNAHKKLHGE
jgi:hypothetical protein